MARIVSGAQQTDPGIAFLEGFQGARQLRQQEEMNRQRQMALMLQIQKAQLAYQKEQTKSRQLLNEQAELGELGALRELALRAQMSPGEVEIENVQGILSRYKDPARQKEAAAALGDIITARQAEEERVQKERQYTKTGEMLQRAVQDQVIDEPRLLDYQQRLEAKRLRGESAGDIAQELMQERAGKAGRDTAAKQNARVYTQAVSLVESLPENSIERERAEYLLSAYEGNSALASEKGSAAKLLSGIHREIYGTREEAQKREAEYQEALRNAQEFGEPLPERPARLGPGLQSFQERYAYESPDLGTERTAPTPTEPGRSSPSTQDLASRAAELYRTGSASEVAQALEEEFGLDLGDPRTQALLRETLQGVSGIGGRTRRRE